MKIYEKFVDGFKSFTENYHLGNPLEQSTNLGPVVRLNAAKNISYVLNAIKELKI